LAPVLKSAPAWLMNWLPPPVSVNLTSPVIVPKFSTVLLSPMLSMAKSASPAVIVPQFISVFAFAERCITPAQHGPPTTVPVFITSVPA
jgi:hypothetical protein